MFRYELQRTRYAAIRDSASWLNVRSNRDSNVQLPVMGSVWLKAEWQLLAVERLESPDYLLPLFVAVQQVLPYGIISAGSFYTP